MSNTIDQLTNGGKRVKTHDAQMVTKLPAAAKALIKKAAQDQQVTEADIVRTALAEYFTRRGYRS
jgi:hypothetical protein